MKQTVLGALIRGFPLALIAAGLALFVIWGGGGGNEAEARHGPGTGNVVVGFDMNTTKGSAAAPKAVRTTSARPVMTASTTAPTASLTAPTRTARAWATPPPASARSTTASR